VDLLQPGVLFQLAVGGLLAGALYALLACGLNLVFGVMRVINLAHAELMMIGAFIAWLAWRYAGLHPLLALPLAMLLLYGLGLVLQRLLIERIVEREELTSLLVTYGLSIILVNLGLLVFSADFRAVPTLQGAFYLEGLDLVISKPRAVAGAVSVVLTLAVYAFLRYSRTGKAIRGVSEHPEVAMICGIDVARIRGITFGLAAAMAGAAGVMLSTIYSFSPDTGADFILKCFAVMIIGGMGNFLGALLGGLLLGLAEALVGGVLSTQWAEAVAYLLLLVLIVRPTGLLGQADAL